MWGIPVVDTTCPQCGHKGFNKDSECAQCGFHHVKTKEEKEASLYYCDFCGNYYLNGCMKHAVEEGE